MLSAISATRFAILLAMIEYAEVPPLAGLSPATEYALLATGDAFWCAPALFAGGGLDADFFIGARGAAGFLGPPLSCGDALVAIV